MNEVSGSIFYMLFPWCSASLSFTARTVTRLWELYLFCNINNKLVTCWELFDETIKINFIQRKMWYDRMTTQPKSYTIQLMMIVQYLLLAQLFSLHNYSVILDKNFCHVFRQRKIVSKKIDKKNDKKVLCLLPWL